jgi:predicted nucleotidyltransferase
MVCRLLTVTYSVESITIMQSDISNIIDKFADESRYALKDNVVVEYLFGSYATQTQTSLSDIDILIIVRNLTLAMQSLMGEIASEYSLKYDLCISPILTDISTWGKNKKSNTLFYQEISRDGVML